MNIEYIVNAEINPIELIRLFRQTDWASTRSAEGVSKMLKHTTMHVSAWHNGRLVGFARAITDTVYRAVIDDVIVDTEYRGRGIGSQLMKRLSNELSCVEEVFFGCDTKHIAFHEKQGYEKAHHPYMKRLKKRS